MKLKFIFLLSVFLIYSTNSFSNDYEEKIEELEEDIKKLKKKIKKQEKDIDKKLKNTKTNDFLDGFKINGRIHVDASWYDENNELKSYNINNYNDNFSIRRARLAVSKEMDNFKFHFEGNFDKDRSYLGETYLSYKLDDNSYLRVGQIINPSFMEREKSSNTMAEIDYNSFIQMGWIPWYIIGLNYYTYQDNFGISTGFFGNGTSIEQQMTNSTYYNFSFRGFYTPIKNDDTILHLGVDLAYQNYKQDASTNPSNIDKNYYFGFELGYRYKIFNWNTEYIKTFYKYDKYTLGGNTFDFDGISTEFILSLTGEYREYSKSGYFTGVKVNNPISKGGYGAFEAVFRYSRAYGDDYKNGFFSNIGSHYDYTFGINWFPEDYFMVLLNYSINSIKNPSFRNSGSKGKYNALKLEFRMFF